MARTRFGVSLEKELADSLERVASALGETRSRVVEEALRLGLGGLEHLVMDEHVCHGIIVARGGEPSLQGLLEERGEYVKASLHYHVGGKCYSLVVFYGPLEELKELMNRARGLGVNVSYIPLH